MNKSKSYKLFYLLSIILVPMLLLVAALLYKMDMNLYLRLTQEDNLLEWSTFAFLLISGLLSLKIGTKLSPKSNPHFWFFIIFGVFCILFSLEEISWGQRIFNVESPEFFLKNSDQREINVHNVIQQKFQVKTKHIAGWTLFVYGVCLPLILVNPKFRSWSEKIRLVVPPPALSFSFFIAALMMFDRPTGREEEIGEFFFSLCFLQFIILETFGEDRSPHAN